MVFFTNWYGNFFRSPTPGIDATVDVDYDHSVAGIKNLQISDALVTVNSEEGVTALAVSG